LAVCLESFVKRDFALWNIPVKRQSEEDFLRDARMHEPGHVLESELPVILRMPNETAALSFQVF
jgi:hypothetical protein